MERTMALKVPQVYSHLKDIRTRTKVSLKSNSIMKDEVELESGDRVQFNLRNYQSIGVYNLLTMKRFLLGDDTGLGKTIETLTTLSYLEEKEPGFKTIIVAPKSALMQWQKEIDRFLKMKKGVVAKGAAKKRYQIYESFFLKEDHFALILNYHILARDWDAIRYWIADKEEAVVKGKKKVTFKVNMRVATIFDEATAFKNPRTKTHDVCYQLSQLSDRVYGLTATMLKNNLLEGFGIFRVVVPGLFKNKTSFMREFCHTQLQPIGGGRKIPIVVGYKNLKKFRSDIDPYFLGRSKTQVSDELPDVITKRIELEFTKIQKEKYAEAISGLLLLEDDVKETTKLTATIYCQQIVDSPYLIGVEGDSEKEKELVRILEEELNQEKVIIYSSFRKMVDRLGVIFDKAGIKYSRITGAESKDVVREQNRARFQDPKSGVDVMLITNAGSAAINLQAASALIFFDSPWSYGDYKQLLGRMVRIGSKHKKVLALHLVVEGSIDAHVLKVLKKKKAIIDPILGTSEDLKFDSESDVDELFKALREDAKRK